MTKLVYASAVASLLAIGTSCKKSPVAGHEFDPIVLPPPPPDPACADGEACDDGDACTTADACLDGTCVGGPALACDDGNGCTDDACEATSGCVFTPNAAACDDGSACTTADACAAGRCWGGPALVCYDANGCTDDACEPAAGCTYTPNAATCDDGNACTTADTCAAGRCMGGPARICFDGNLCTDDACEPAMGCVHAANAAFCNDNDECTTGDVCSAGACRGGPAPICNDGNGCTFDLCNAALGCWHLDNAMPCDDGSACTVNDFCSAGSCVSGAFPNCDDGNACTDDACGADGSCLHDANTVLCDDGDFCTLADACSAGACGGTMANCDDSQVCTDDACDPSVGCVNADNTAACDDQNSCSTADFCSAGLCNAGAPVGCDDGNLCTDDSCDAASGCAHAFNTLPCDDGQPGTIDDTCFNGACNGMVPEEGRPFQILAAQSDADLIDRFTNSVILAVPPDASFSPVPASATGVVLVGDYVMVGINSLGHLNTNVSTFATPEIRGWRTNGSSGSVSLPTMTGGYPGNYSGFAFRADPALDFEQDALSPGCLCEGWGVRFSSGGFPYEGGAAVSGQNLLPATPVLFAMAYDNAQAAWFVRARAAAGPMEITTDISLRRADRYVSLRVALRNTGVDPITDVRFVRSLDFDIGPGHYNGDSFDFLYSLGVPQLIRAHDEIDSLDPDPTPNDNFYGVATVSPHMTCADGFTFMTTNPDSFLGGFNCNVDPAGALGDYSSSFVFEPFDIPVGGAAEL